MKKKAITPADKRLPAGGEAVRGVGGHIDGNGWDCPEFHEAFKILRPAKGLP
jgi:hypothetical protein